MTSWMAYFGSILDDFLCPVDVLLTARDSASCSHSSSNARRPNGATEHPAKGLRDRRTRQRAVHSFRTRSKELGVAFNMRRFSSTQQVQSQQRSGMNRLQL
jgi:hypothetical protein